MKAKEAKKLMDEFNADEELASIRKDIEINVRGGCVEYRKHLDPRTVKALQKDGYEVTIFTEPIYTKVSWENVL